MNFLDFMHSQNNCITFWLCGSASKGMDKKNMDMHKSVLSIEGELQISHFFYALFGYIYSSFFFQLPENNIQYSISLILAQ